jgi:hypothetical protein
VHRGCESTKTVVPQQFIVDRALTTLAAVSRARGARRPSALRQQTDPAAGAGAALRLPTEVADFFFAIPVRGGRWSSGVRGERS